MTTTQQTIDVAMEINRQVERGVKMALGYHAPRVIDGGLQFSARILPFCKDGSRSTRARNMTVRITLNAADYYDIVVTYTAQSSTLGLVGKVHAQAHDVDCFELSKCLLALDYDGPTPFNPCYYYVA